jgi:malate dehydrogenase (oxaloacetate-decarboxylating)(NADP+)
VIAEKVAALDLRLDIGQDVRIVDPDDEQVYTKAAEAYYAARKRDGVSRALALSRMRANGSLLAAWLLEHGEGDAMLCGAIGRTPDHLAAIRDVIGLRPGVRTLAVMQMLLLPHHQLFICDTHCNADPDAEQITEIALLAAEEVGRFGVTPRVALLSHSSFGTSDLPSAQKMRQARELIRRRNPNLAVEGEMHGDAALSPDILHDKMPDTEFVGPANLLVMPNLDAANISYNLLRIAAGNGVTIGGIVLGAARPAHILTPSATVRRIVNMAAFAAVDVMQRSER